MRAVLENIGLTDLGRHEKLAWEYPFLYGAVPCSVALEKFGPTFHNAGGRGGRTIGTSRRSSSRSWGCR
jgi:hypothetical protein